MDCLIKLRNLFVTLARLTRGSEFPDYFSYYHGGPLYSALAGVERQDYALLHVAINFMVLPERLHDLLTLEEAAIGCAPGTPPVIRDGKICPNAIWKSSPLFGFCWNPHSDLMWASLGDISWLYKIHPKKIVIVI